MHSKKAYRYHLVTLELQTGKADNHCQTSTPSKHSDVIKTASMHAPNTPQHLCAQASINTHKCAFRGKGE